MGYGVAVSCGGGVLVAVGCGGTGVLVAVATGVLVAGGGRVGVSVAGGIGVSVAGGKVGVSGGLWKTADDGRRPAETGSTKMAASTSTAATKMKREVCFIAIDLLKFQPNY